MKLLYITNQICGSAGLERVLSIKASYLTDSLNYEIHILTLNQGDTPLFYDFSKKITHHDVTAKGNPLQYFINYKKGIKSTIKKVNPDVISVCDDGLKGLLLPYIIGKPCPMVYERHVSKNIEVQKDKINSIKKIATSLKFKLMNLGANSYDKFIVLTNGNLSEWGKVNNKIVIPNPISFYPEKDDLSTLTNKTVLVVGRQCYQKGYDNLLKIWKQVNSKHPEWKLKVFGKIQEGEPYTVLAKQLNIVDSVMFYKPIKNIKEEYKKASIYAMSSRFEGFGMVLIEAMAYGVPCVSFDCPHGPSDIIKDQSTGFIVENNNTAVFSSRLNQLIEDIELRKQMGLKSREKAKIYLPNKIVPLWDNLFKELI